VEYPGTNLANGSCSDDQCASCQLCGVVLYCELPQIYATAFCGVKCSAKMAARGRSAVCNIWRMKGRNVRKILFLHCYISEIYVQWSQIRVREPDPWKIFGSWRCDLFSLGYKFVPSHSKISGSKNPSFTTMDVLLDGPQHRDGGFLNGKKGSRTLV
jgi:hypothetical protein